MTKGKGLIEFDLLLQEHPPEANAGVLVGDNLYQDLVRAKRITVEQWYAVGLPNVGAKLPTLDKKYFVERHLLMGEDEFEFK